MGLDIYIFKRAITPKGKAIGRTTFISLSVGGKNENK
jgi:hypothetical protein